MNNSRFQLAQPLSDQVARQRRLTNDALGILDQWGYTELEVPLLAPFDRLREAVGDRVSEELFRFVDRDGRLLVLRGDLTPAVAAQLVPTIASEKLPIRVAYASRIARIQREFAREQAESVHLGVELIGSDEADGDLEVLAVLADLLDGIGLDDYELHIGNVLLARGAIEALPEARRDVALRAISRRDAATVAELFDESAVNGSQRDLAMALCRIRVELEEIEAMALTASPLCARGWESLQTLFERLDELGRRDRVRLDLSAVNRRGYYTGMHVSVLSGAVGTIVGSGGRYDELYGRFGADASAVGFSLRIDTLTGQEVRSERSDRVAIAPSDDVVARLREAADRRAAGERLSLSEPSPASSAPRSGPAPASDALRIAIPKGRLLKQTVAQLRTAGLVRSEQIALGRKLVIEVPETEAELGLPMELLLLKNADVPTYVEHGVADIGVCGSDVLDENGSDVFRPHSFAFGRCRIALAGGDDTALRVMQSGGVATLATKYDGLARELLGARGWSADVIHLNGSVELGAVLGLADGIVDLVETGNTLKENDLHVLHVLGMTRVYLVANRSLVGARLRAVARLVELLSASEEG